eukprot:7434430-Heterocapsa_arctica.AAC.1
MRDGTFQFQALGQTNDFLYGDQDSSAVPGNLLTDQNVIAIGKYNQALSEAYQQLTPETNDPFSIA